MSERPDLNELRGKLDEIDNSILDLLEERMAACRQIGNYKREHGMDVYVPSREEEKFKALEEIAGFESRPYVRELFKTLMDISKDHQNKPAFGVLGRTLAHTYSPEIHSLFDSSYSYSVIEREPEELEALFKSGVFKGFNVTIPYKKNACAMCDELDDASKTTGSVNTVLFEDGKVKGWNTDYFGFIYMLTRKGISVKDKKVLVLGTGGAASAVFYALKTLGAAETYACDLETDINYSNVYDRAGDAQVIVNCTPVGMFPKVDNSLLDLTTLQEQSSCRKQKRLVLRHAAVLQCSWRRHISHRGSSQATPQVPDFSAIPTVRTAQLMFLLKRQNLSRRSLRSLRTACAISPS